MLYLGELKLAHQAILPNVHFPRYMEVGEPRHIRQRSEDAEIRDGLSMKLSGCFFVDGQVQIDMREIHETANVTAPQFKDTYLGILPASTC